MPVGEMFIFMKRLPGKLWEGGSNRTITPSSNPVVPGEYDIYGEGRTIQITDELWFARLITHTVSGRDHAFRDGVRARDVNCVVSGRINNTAPWNSWHGFQAAAHVFPLEKESLWIQYNYQRWITNMDSVTGSSKINSIQNGLLLSNEIHDAFDQYLFSINPDDGYKITSFCPDNSGIDGKTLDPVCRDPGNPDGCVGEPIFEADFPPGTDMMETLRNEPCGKERFEMELEKRLRFVGESQVMQSA
ncbi:hypothetical protein V8E54_008629 [Elaphomyces granulatus]